MEASIMENTITSAAAAATPAPTTLFDFGHNMDRAWKFADVLSKSAIVPDTFRGNTASCLIALDMAVRMRRNPMEIMQAMYIVHGKPFFSSSFLISLINSCGFFEPLRFAFQGDGMERSCVAWTVDKRVGERVEGPVISIEMAKLEGWYDKSGSKWKTMPDVMLRYRAAAFFSRAYCPDLTGGFHSVEEAADIERDYEAVSVKSAKELEAELMEQPKSGLARKPTPNPDPDPEPTRKKHTNDSAPEAKPAAPLVLLDDPDEKKAPPAVTEVETLRANINKLFRETLGWTELELGDWLRKNFTVNEVKQLAKDKLKAALEAGEKILAARDEAELGPRR
jgi:hypothetical protein